MSEQVMPPKVAQAVAAVMSKVPRLNKGERNSHGNYNFASIDDFLEAVRPLMAEAGLVTTADEDECEIVEKWLKLRFVFYAHCGGESFGPMRRSAMVLSSMGAQALGAAQSYAEKNFLRSLFKIATGEGASLDADSHPQEQLAQPRQRQQPPRLKGPIKTRAEVRTACGDFVRELHSCGDGDQLEAFIAESKPLIDQVKDELEFFWLGDGADFAGMEKEIENARNRVYQGNPV